MDRRYIENEHIVDRYLSGDLTVKEARDFEKYCRDHPEVLATMPIPVRLKARLSRRPTADAESETGVFKTIPSSASHAALQAIEDGFDVDEEREELSRRYGGGGVSRVVALALVVALLAAIAGLVMYAMQASSMSKQLATAKRDMHAQQMQAYGRSQTYKVQPARSRPEQATLAIGWVNPPELIDLHIDMSQTKFTQFRVTIDRVDGGRAMVIHRTMRDSNKELRIGLNSSAFGPGEYMMQIDGYNWRGQVEQFGWVRIGLE